MIEQRRCFRDPIPEIYESAELLNQALIFHLKNEAKKTKELLLKSDMPVIRDWTESIWGAKSPYIKIIQVNNPKPRLKKNERIETRMPDKKIKDELISRDGHNCVFCGIPVIRTEVRNQFKKLYPNEVPWGRKNIEQHSGFQAMWLQYDHFVPHSRGGNNNLDNIVITCAPCNFGRMEYTIEEVGLLNPFERDRIKFKWNGLEEILT
tara:strand:+ start:147 stop:767 length:621 start_codon:yes stop_codon:yes gene_type:complete